MEDIKVGDKVRWATLREKLGEFDRGEITYKQLENYRENIHSYRKEYKIKTLQNLDPAIHFYDEDGDLLEINISYLAYLSSGKRVFSMISTPIGEILRWINSEEALDQFDNGFLDNDELEEYFESIQDLKKTYGNTFQVTAHNKAFILGNNDKDEYDELCLPLSWLRRKK